MLLQSHSSIKQAIHTCYTFAEIARYADRIKVLFRQIPIMFGRQRQNEITFAQQLYI